MQQQAVGTSTLMAWDAGVTAEALRLMAAAAVALAADCGGYVAAAEGDEVLAAFDNTVGTALHGSYLYIGRPRASARERVAPPRTGCLGCPAAPMLFS